MVAEEIALENKEKQLSTLKQNQDNRSVQMDKTDDNKKSHTSPTHTREQVANVRRKIWNSCIQNQRRSYGMDA